MAMPGDVTAADIAGWDRDFQEHLDAGGPWVPRHLWHTACWLQQQLEALNCDRELCRRILFATGQRLVHAEDAWLVVVHALENYRRGQWEEPGPELAARLLRDAYGDNPSRGAIIADLRKKGFNLGAALRRAPQTWE